MTCTRAGDGSIDRARPAGASVTRHIVHAALDAPPEAFPPWRALNTPGVTVTVREMVDALGRAGGDPSLVRFEVRSRNDVAHKDMVA